MLAGGVAAEGVVRGRRRLVLLSQTPEIRTCLSPTPEIHILNSWIGLKRSGRGDDLEPGARGADAVLGGPTADQDSGGDKAVTVARPTVLRVAFGSVLSISAGFGYFDVDTPEQVVACLCLFDS